jgi:hypothetical protein
MESGGAVTPTLSASTSARSGLIRSGAGDVRHDAVEHLPVASSELKPSYRKFRR